MLGCNTVLRVSMLCLVVVWGQLAGFADTDQRHRSIAKGGEVAMLQADDVYAYLSPEAQQTTAAPTSRYE